MSTSTSRVASPWFPFRKPTSPTRTRLFCLPYAGGGASVYRSLSEHLPADMEVCPVELAGRGTRSREAPFTHAPLLVVGLAQAMRPLLDRPYAIFGYSLGALLAFEVTRQLRRERQPLPSHLFVAARHAPHLPSPDAVRYMRTDAELIEELRRLGGTPQEVLDNEDLLQFLLPCLRADFTVDDTYVHREEPPLPCPMTAIGGLWDGGVPRDSLEAWRIHTAGACRAHLYPGGHFFLHHSAPQIAGVIGAALRPRPAAPF
jgi:medium-chain acyl-[acyl-carrier-protein] hydrolase